MCSADSNHQSKDQIAARNYLLSLVFLTLCLICVSDSILLAQSGRRQSPADAETDSAKSSRFNTNDKKDNRSTTDFIVITAPPDFIPENLYSGYSQSPNFEYLARRGFQLELKTLPEANVIEDEDVGRWEARETALTEDKAWIIWMELKWEKTIPVNTSPFRLRYLLFEPGTGKLVASGFGKGSKQTWGTPQRNTTLEEQVQEAGRNIADQVLSEIKKRSVN